MILVGYSENMINSGSKTTSNMNKLLELQRSTGTVFTAQDMAVIWGYTNERRLFELIKYYVRRGEIFALSRGLYSWRDYTELDIRNDLNLQLLIANKLVPNSYVSLYTVLKKEGLVDQYYDAVYSVAEKRVTRMVRGVRFEYKRIKDKVLWSSEGINESVGVRVATKERAVLDTWYCEPSWELGRTELLNMLELKELAKMYGGRVVKKAKELEQSNVKH